MYCHCGTNNRVPRWTFTDPCKPEVRPGAREESASPAWLAAPAMNARDTTKVYTWRLDTGCGSTLYRKCHSHNTPGKRHNNDKICFIPNSLNQFSVIPFAFDFAFKMHNKEKSFQHSVNYMLAYQPVCYYGLKTVGSAIWKSTITD